MSVMKERRTSEFDERRVSVKTQMSVMKERGIRECSERERNK